MMQNRVRETAAKKLLFLPLSARTFRMLRSGTKQDGSAEREHDEVLSLSSRVTPWNYDLY